MSSNTASGAKRIEFDTGEPTTPWLPVCLRPDADRYCVTCGRPFGYDVPYKSNCDPGCWGIREEVVDKTEVRGRISSYSRLFKETE